MKSTQDLHKFLKEITEIRGKQVVVTIYPDKSFVLNEFTPASDMLEPIYISDQVVENLDINDLAYENPAQFSKHIDELASVAELLAKTNNIHEPPTFDDV